MIIVECLPIFFVSYNLIYAPLKNFDRKGHFHFINIYSNSHTDEVQNTLVLGNRK